MPKPSDYDPTIGPQGGRGQSPDIVCDELVDQVLEWLTFRWYKSKIKAALNEIVNQGRSQYDPGYCPISPRTVETLLKLARERMVENSKRSNEEFRAESKELYERCLADPKASWHAKIQAQQSLDALMGTAVLQEALIKKAKKELEKDDSGTADDSAAKIRDSLRAMDQSVVGPSSAGGEGNDGGSESEVSGGANS